MKQKQKMPNWLKAIFTTKGALILTVGVILHINGKPEDFMFSMVLILAGVGILALLFFAQCIAKDIWGNIFLLLALLSWIIARVVFVIREKTGNPDMVLVISIIGGVFLLIHRKKMKKT